MALVSHSESGIQSLVDTFSEASGRMGLQTNTRKKEVIYQPSPDNTATREPDIRINGDTLNAVNGFIYLGSTLTPDNRADKEISCRIQSACAAYAKLGKKTVE